MAQHVQSLNRVLCKTKEACPELNLILLERDDLTDTGWLVPQTFFVPSAKFRARCPIAHWTAAHATAEIYAPESIHKKIARKTKIDSLQTVDRLANQLPDFVTLHIPPPNFFHQVWISVKKGDTTYWLVGDKFLNFNKVEGNFIMRFSLALYGIKAGLRLHALYISSLTKL